MRKFVNKWKSIIVWGIAIFFTFGIIWWSIAMYMSYRRPNVRKNEYNPRPEDAVAILTKEGTPLNWKYWLMPQELEKKASSMIQMYRIYKQSYDDLFDGPIVRLSTAKSLLNDKVTLYYADTHNLKPSKEEIEEQVNKIVEGYIKDERLKNYIIQKYGSIDAFKKIISDDVFMGLLKDKVKGEVIKVTEEEVKKYFEDDKENIKERYDKVKLKHILLNSKEKAEDVLNMINSGKLDFTKAASEYSLDEDTKKTGGELGWITRGYLDTNLAEAAFSATLNVPTGPIESSSGWHIINVEDRMVINTFDDLKQATQAYKDVKDKVIQDKFTKWLDEYKKKEKISYVFEDESLKLYDEYYNIVISTPSTYTDEKLKAFMKKLEDMITIESTQATAESTTSTVSSVINTNVDPTILSLYVTVVEGLYNDVYMKAYRYRRYVTLSQSVPKDLLNMSDEEIESKITELDKKLENATGTKYEELFQEKLSYRNAQTLKTLKKNMDKENITLEEARELVEKYDKLEEYYEDKIKKALYALYEMAPYSKKVLSKLHSYDPENPSITLRFYQSMYEDIKPYLSDPKALKDYASYIIPRMYSVKEGLKSLLEDEKASTDLKVQALETLVSLSQDKGDYKEELEFLNKLKEISPNYPDIDDFIADVKAKLEASTTSTETAITTPTGFSTSTENATKSEK